jgi:peptidoglycan/LPS O-acetylase OafA/YrhL
MAGRLSICVSTRKRPLDATSSGVAPPLPGRDLCREHGLLVVGCLHPRICAYKNDLLTKMGDASYSTYLSHPFILIAMAAMYHPVTWTLGSAMTCALVGCVLCQITGWLCYRVVERPMTQWLQGFMPGKRYAYSPAVPSA